MRPRVGLMNFVSRLKQVVLPAPFGPISAWMVPRATRRLTPFTATKPANSLVRFSVSRMKSSLTTPRPRLLATVVARPQQVQQNAWGSRPARSLAGNRGQAASRPGLTAPGPSRCGCDPFVPAGAGLAATPRGITVAACTATLPQASPHYYVMALCNGKMALATADSAGNGTGGDQQEYSLCASSSSRTIPTSTGNSRLR